MICAVVRIPIKPEMHEAMVRGFVENAAKVKASEPGTRLYTLNKSQDEPDVYYAVEFYDDKAAMDLHLANFQKVAEKLSAPLSAPPTFQVFDYTTGFGVPGAPG